VTERGVRVEFAVGGPLYAAFFRLVPLADSFRVPGRFTLFTAFVVAVLAAFGYDRLVAREVGRREWLLPGGVVAGAVGLFAVVLAFEGVVRGTVVGDVPGLYPLVVRELGVAAAVAVGSLAVLVAVDRRARLAALVGDRSRADLAGGSAWPFSSRPSSRSSRTARRWSRASRSRPSTTSRPSTGAS
jgi:hypothetical protein